MEEVARNTQIFCAKEGLREPTDKQPTERKATYRELGKKYDLSITYLQTIVNRYRKRYKYFPKKEYGKNKILRAAETVASA